MTDDDDNLVPLSQISLEEGDSQSILVGGSWGSGDVHVEHSTVGHFFAVKDHDGRVLKVWRVDRNEMEFVLLDEHIRDEV